MSYYLCDNCDGKYARATAQTSEFGAILDHFVDGTVGIWAGTIGLQYGIGVDQYNATIGLFFFTLLFYIVHSVHAYSGFFELGGDYLSIDEGFILISISFLLHALNIKDLPFISSSLCHQMIIGGIITASIGWIILYGHKIKFDWVKKRWFMLVPGFIYFAYMATGGLQKCLNQGVMGPAAIVSYFFIPYGCVLWESKDKH